MVGRRSRSTLARSRDLWHARNGWRKCVDWWKLNLQQHQNYRFEIFDLSYCSDLIVSIRVIVIMHTYIHTPYHTLRHTYIHHMKYDIELNWINVISYREWIPINYVSSGGKYKLIFENKVFICNEIEHNHIPFMC